MKKITACLVISICLININAQDSIRAINVFRHKIVDGRPGSEKTLIEQKTFNKNNQLILQQFYSDSNLVFIKSQTRFYYKDTLVISAETFSGQAKVQTVKRYSYNAEGQIEQERIYKPANHKMGNIQTMQYTWQDNHLIREVILNENLKKIVQKDYKYEEDKITITISYKKGNTPENLKSKIVTKWLSGERIIRKETDQMSYSKIHSTQHIEYSYNDNGKLKEEKWLDDKDQLISSFQYNWFANGNLNNKLAFNKDGIQTEFLKYEYHDHVTTLNNLPMFDLNQTLNH